MNEMVNSSVFTWAIRKMNVHVAATTKPCVSVNETEVAKRLGWESGRSRAMQVKGKQTWRARRAQELFVPGLQRLTLECWWLGEVWSAVYAFYWVRMETKHNREAHQGAERKTLWHPVCSLGDSLSAAAACIFWPPACLASSTSAVD